MSFIKDLVKKFDNVASSAEASEKTVMIREGNKVTIKPLSDVENPIIKIPGELTPQEKYNAECGIINDKISIAIPFPKRLSPDGRAIISVSRADYETSMKQGNESNIFPIGRENTIQPIIIQDGVSADGKHKLYKKVLCNTGVIAQRVEEAQNESFSKRGNEFDDIVEPDDTQRELGE